MAYNFIMNENIIELGPITSMRKRFVTEHEWITHDGPLYLSYLNDFLLKNGAISAHTLDGKTITHISFNAQNGDDNEFKLLLDLKNEEVSFRSTFYEFPFHSLKPINVERLLTDSTMNSGENDLTYSEIAFLLHQIGRTLRDFQLDNLDQILTLLGEGTPSGSDIEPDETGLRFDPRLLE